MNFFKQSIKIFAVSGFILTAFMGVTEIFQIVQVPPSTIEKFGGTVPFGVSWFLYEGLRFLFIVWILQIFGVLRFAEMPKFSNADPEKEIHEGANEGVFLEQNPFVEDPHKRLSEKESVDRKNRALHTEDKP